MYGDKAANCSPTLEHLEPCQLVRGRCSAFLLVKKGAGTAHIPDIWLVLKWNWMNFQENFELQLKTVLYMTTQKSCWENLVLHNSPNLLLVFKKNVYKKIPSLLLLCTCITGKQMNLGKSMSLQQMNNLQKACTRSSLTPIHTGRQLALLHFMNMLMWVFGSSSSSPPHNVNHWQFFKSHNIVSFQSRILSWDQLIG